MLRNRDMRRQMQISSMEEKSNQKKKDKESRMRYINNKYNEFDLQ